MYIIEGISNYREEKAAAATVGKFDGLHLGHRLLTDHMKRVAMAQNLLSVLVTFQTSPRRALFGEEKLIITKEERFLAAKDAGIDVILLLPFDDQMIHMEPEDFVQMLAEKLHLRYFVSGPDFHFGYKGRGDVRLLEQLSGEFGFRYELLSKLKRAQQEVSSTLIREKIAAADVPGNLEAANELLGYPYFVYGEVSHGNRIGHSMGIPTINLVPPESKLLPPYGVYVSRCEVAGRAFASVTDVGMKPTVSGKGVPDLVSPVVETHIIDEGVGEFLNLDFYGASARVSFLRFIRREQKFDSLAALKAQIGQDVALAREVHGVRAQG